MSLECFDLMILGSGMSGVSALRHWASAGGSAVIIEKSRGIGGRASTKRLGEFTFADLGAQYVSLATESFRFALQGLNLSPVTVPGKTYSRYVHPQGINQILKHLIREFPNSEIRFQEKGVEIKKVSPSSGMNVLEIVLESGRALRAKNIIITSPMPQSLSFFKEKESFLKDAEHEYLKSVSFHPCLALAIVEKSGAKELGHEAFPAIQKNISESIEGIYEQRSKGLQIPNRVWVVHASAEFSAKSWGLSDEQILHSLYREAKAACPQIPAAENVAQTHLHRWRYCRPRSVLTEPFFKLSDTSCGSIYFTGDAFQRSSLEGAFLSGQFAAQDLHQKPIPPI